MPKDFRIEPKVQGRCVPGVGKRTAQAVLMHYNIAGTLPVVLQNTPLREVKRESEGLQKEARPLLSMGNAQPISEAPNASSTVAVSSVDKQWRDITVSSQQKTDSPPSPAESSTPSSDDMDCMDGISECMRDAHVQPDPMPVAMAKIEANGAHAPRGWRCIPNGRSGHSHARRGC